MFNPSELQEHLNSLEKSLIESASLESDLVTKLASELSELAAPVFGTALETGGSVSIDSAENKSTDHNLDIPSSTSNFGLQLNNLSLSNQVSSKSFTPTLEAGNYVQNQAGNINDNLTLSANGASISGATFDPVYGYGLVDAATAVAAVVGQYPFPEVQDLGGENWGNDLINAPEVWTQGYTGQGVTVAVIDSGIDVYHQDLSGNIWQNTGEIAGNGLDDDGNQYIDDIYGWNFGEGQYNNNVLPGTTSSGQGHGTHVAGTIAALNNGFGVTGVAYDADIMALRLGDVDNQGRFINGGNVAEAIRYAVDNGADVINMSLSWDDSPALQSALAYAASYNVVTVSSAGNDAQPSPYNPASYATHYGISVGSVDSNGIISNFSNGAGYNSSMQHVVAPGGDGGQLDAGDIYSTLPGDDYGFNYGTSMAAPHVAGVAALMLGANPYLTADLTRQVLTGTATSLSGYSSSFEPSVDLLSIA